MKKIILLFIVAFALNSCSTEDDSPHVTYQLLPIQNCQMPYKFTYGATYEFKMFFKRPSSCHFYKGIYFEKDGNTRIVAIQSGVVESNNCVPYDDNNALVPQDSTKCNFKVTAHDTYTFKFWTGKNEQGENTYYEVEVPVQN